MMKHVTGLIKQQLEELKLFFWISSVGKEDVDHAHTSPGLETRERDLPWHRAIVLSNMSDCNKGTTKRSTQIFVTVALKSSLAWEIAEKEP